MASSNNSPIRYYLDIISRWQTTAALASLWFVVFELKGVGALHSVLGDTVSELETREWDISQSTVEVLTSDAVQSQAYSASGGLLSGCVFARQVSLPGESVDIKTESSNWGGLKGLPVGGNRAANESLQMTFLETNASFCDMVIRPWLILIGHYGLVARADRRKNVKCPAVHLFQLAKGGITKDGALAMQVRKRVTFFDVVPSSLTGTSVSQNEEGLTNRTVNFSYSNYSIGEEDTSSYTNEFAQLLNRLTR